MSNQPTTPKSEAYELPKDGSDLSAASCSALDYLANQMYQNDARSNGSSGWCWMCLSDEIKAEWKSKASAEIELWKFAEKQQEASRQELL